MYILLNVPVAVLLVPGILAIVIFQIPRLIGNIVLDKPQWIPMDKLMDSLEMISCLDVIAVQADRLKD